MNRIFVSIVALALLAGGVAYVVMHQVSPRILDSKKLHVVASFYPMAFFATQIAGDKADVINVTPAGAEPHEYDPSSRDIANMHNADIIILNGTVESWAAKIQENLAGTNVAIVTAGNGLADLQADPHVWLSPVLAKKEVEKIAQAFEQVDPNNIATYQANATRLYNQLDELDREYTAGLSSCAKKEIVTSHAAFAYMAQQYGLSQVAIAGLSPDAEPSPKDLVAVANFVKQHDVYYIFFESLVSPKLADTIAQETGAKTLELNPLEGLTADQLQHGDDYFSVMRSNLKNLQLALGCTV